MTMSSDKSGLQVLGILPPTLYNSIDVLDASVNSIHHSINGFTLFLQVAIHAIGDRANDLVLDIYKSVATTGMRDRRFRVKFIDNI